MAIFKSKAAPTEDTKESSAAEPKPNVLESKLDGENIPEKFRGKSVTDLLQIYEDTDRKRTFAENEARQWREFVESGEAPQQKQQQSVDEELDEDAAKAVTAIVQKAVEPLVKAYGSMQRDYIMETRDDFDKFGKRADEIFAGLKPEHKVDPEYGYGFAYNLARVEAEGKTVPKKPAPPPPAPTAGEQAEKKKDELSDVQVKHMKMMGMDEARYRKYMNVYDPVGEAMKNE